MLITEIGKNRKERVRVSIEEYKGHKFIDCRVFFEDDQDEWRPFKKGIALNGESIHDVIEALKTARMHLINQINRPARSINCTRKIDNAESMRLVSQGIGQKEITEHCGVSPPAVFKQLKQLLPKDGLKKQIA